MGIFGWLLGKRKTKGATEPAATAPRAQATSSWLDILGTGKDSESVEAISFDESQELREANALALDAGTAEKGIGKLREIINQHPDCSDPYCLLAQALNKAARSNEAEHVLLEAFPKVFKKSVVAASLGSLYFFEKANLQKSTEWYLKSVVCGPHDWGAHLYLSGIYRSYGFAEASSALQEAANEIRGNPVSLDQDWQKQLGMLKEKVSADSMTPVLAETWEKVIKGRLKERSAQQAPAEGAVTRPDLKCSLCGNANVVLEYGSSTHCQCLECKTIFCNRCQKKYGWRCPKCNAIESCDYLYE